MRTAGQVGSRRSERRVADLLGGRAVAASGAFWHSKGDVRTSEFLVEHKWTDRNSFSITKAVWKKIRGEAILGGRVPILMVRLGDDGTNLVVMDEDDFIELHRAAHPDAIA